MWFVVVALARPLGHGGGGEDDGDDGNTGDD